MSKKVLVVAEHALLGAGLSIVAVLALFLVAVLPEVPGMFIALAAMLGIWWWAGRMADAIRDLCKEERERWLSD